MNTYQSIAEHPRLRGVGRISQWMDNLNGQARDSSHRDLLPKREALHSRRRQELVRSDIYAYQSLPRQQPGDIPVDLQPGVAPVPFKYNLPAAVTQADCHDGIQGLINALAHIMAGGTVNQPALSL